MVGHSKTIFRTAKRENPYAQIDKTVLNDARLSWKAKGLMAFLLSKPDTWEINIKNLVRQAKDGKEAVYSGIAELIKFGYLVRTESRNNGRFAQIVYLIYENPQLVQPTKSDFSEKIESVRQTTSKTPLPGNPDTVKPDAAFPDTENPPPVMNDLSVRNDLTKVSLQKLPEGSGDKPDFAILEPVAVKLFGQANPEILEKLGSKIKEFRLDGEVVQECLSQIDAEAIKFNPYGYFKGVYAVAMATVAKRAQMQEREKQLQELLQRQYCLDASDNDGKSPAEVISDIRKKLGIDKDSEAKEPSHEPN